MTSLKRTYTPADCCIYCHSTVYAVGSKRFLAEEHIIPFGLGGQLVLPRASCRKCERKTGRQESILLRGALLGCRTILKLPTRSPKDRPKALPIFVGEQNRKVMIPIEDFPVCLMLLGFPPPPFLFGGEAGNSTAVAAHFFRRDTSAIQHRHGVSTSFALGSIDTFALQYTLAKIGHAFAVAELGLGSFNPLLLEYLYNGEAKPTHFVGGTGQTEPKSENRHELSFLAIDGRPDLLAVRIRLFADFGMPAYLVVVGVR